MSKQFKLLLIAVNVLLGLLYLFSSFVLWQELNNWYDYNMQSTWTPFYVYPHRIPGMSTVEMPVPPMLNLPFITFIATIITNSIIIAAYYLVVSRLQKWATKNV